MCVHLSIHRMVRKQGQRVPGAEVEESDEGRVGVVKVLDVVGDVTEAGLLLVWGLAVVRRVVVRRVVVRLMVVVCVVLRVVVVGALVVVDLAVVGAGVDGAVLVDVNGSGQFSEQLNDIDIVLG